MRKKLGRKFGPEKISIHANVLVKTHDMLNVIMEFQGFDRGQTIDRLVEEHLNRRPKLRNGKS